MIDFDTQIVLLTIIVSMGVAMAIEAVRPFHADSGMPLWRWLNNLSLTALDFLTLFGMAPLLGLLIIQQSAMEPVGLLARTHANPVLAFAVVLVVLEFLSYCMHRLFHAIPWLWRIHAVHHCDTQVDATTSHRHHPLEVVISAIVTFPVIVLLGPDPTVLLIYNGIHAAFAVLSHGNFSLNHKWDQWLARVVVTPNFHRMHHASEQRYTDSNYGSVLSCFDHWFGTASHLPPDVQKNMKLGLSYFRDKSHGRLDQLLLMPFQPTTALPLDNEPV